MALTKPNLHQLLNQGRRRYSTFEQLEEEVTRQIANSSEIEYLKLSFEEIITCFDLLDTLAVDLAAFSTQEAPDCLNTASTLRKRNCDLLINVRKNEKVLKNDGSVSTRSNSPLRVQGTSATASLPVRRSNTTENLANNFISTTAADFSSYTSAYGVITTSTTDFRSTSPSAISCTFNFRAPLRHSFSPPPVSNSNHIWNDKSRHEAQMSTGNNRYVLLTTSIANSLAITSEQFVTNYFDDHHRTVLQSLEEQRNSLFDNDQRQVTNHATSHPTTAINCTLKGFKMPDIKLQELDGNPLEWNNWFELFQTAIGNNQYSQTLLTCSHYALIKLNL